MIIGDALTKTAFASAARAAATSLKQDIERLLDLQETYIARGYVSGGTDPITDADISNSKITASQLNSLLNTAWLVTKINLLMTEQVVAGTIQGNNIIDAIRSDL